MMIVIPRVIPPPRLIGATAQYPPAPFALAPQGPYRCMPCEVGGSERVCWMCGGPMN